MLKNHPKTEIWEGNWRLVKRDSAVRDEVVLLATKKGRPRLRGKDAETGKENRCLSKGPGEGKMRGRGLRASLLQGKRALKRPGAVAVEKVVLSYEMCLGCVKSVEGGS